MVLNFSPAAVFKHVKAEEPVRESNSARGRAKRDICRNILSVCGEKTSVQSTGASPPRAKQVICRRTGSRSCYVIRRLAEQTGTGDGAIELRTVELLTQRLTWMETKEPHTTVQRTEVYSFSSASVTDAFPSTAQTRHGITHGPPALAQPDV
ncbi:hypothetical protein EYF80_029988 [Liparis tanakae]|uniref:Uncharacterized protein n=1 Tax=Liparis tanakae TaxID=230148 RepID=A0A4Z2H3Y5_9TELE|nr:hypothetical protein EYF80_029988 [Liparis tanakae]